MNKNSFFIYRIITFLLLTSFSLSSGINLENETIFNRIASKYLVSFSKPKLTAKEIKSVLDPIDPSKVDQIKLKAILEEKTNIFKRKKITFELFNQNQLSKEIEKNIEFNPITSETLWQDLELFCGQHVLSSSLLSKINKTETNAGTAVLSKMLAKPTTNINELHRRQNIIKELVKNEKLFEQLDSIIKNYATSEIEILSFWDEKTFSNIFGSDNYFPCFPFNVIPKKLLDEALVSRKTQNEINESPSSLNFINFINIIRAIQDISGQVSKIKYAPKYAKEELNKLKNHYNEFKKNYNLFKNNLQNAGLSSKSQAGKDLISSIWNIGLIPIWDWPQVTYNIAQIPLGIFSIYKTLEGEKDRIKSLLIAHCKLKNAAQAISNLKKINKIINSNDILKSNINCLEELKYLFEKTSSNSRKLDKLIEQLTSITFKKQTSLITALLHRSKILSCAFLMTRAQNGLVDILKKLGEVDAYLSIAKLYKKSLSKNANYCFAQYETQEKPFISLKDYWTPFIKANLVVTNNIEIGGKEPLNIMISGPNAGGKSTILKAIVINLLMAQTLGIAPAKELIFTPFSYIDTYLNITDDISSGNSLFKSEVLRVKNLLDTIKSLPYNNFSFVVMDEIFSGTNPIEGEAAGYAIGKYLSNIPNNISIIASHFPKLTSLENDTNGNFKNYKVTVNKYKDGAFNYPFKLEEGKADQTIAIDILKAAKFDPKIITDAYSVIE